MKILKKPLLSLAIPCLVVTLSSATQLENNSTNDNTGTALVKTKVTTTTDSNQVPVKIEPITKKKVIKVAQPTKPKVPLQPKVPVKLPTVPTPPKAIQISNSIDTSRAIKFSKRVPPNYIPHRFDQIKKVKTSPNTSIGEVDQGRISAYLRGEFMEVETVEEKLKAAGFNVLTSVPVNKKGTLISVVFTNDTLITMSSKETRGFLATLRVLVDTKKQTISITNPLYMAKGFLQDDFEETSAKSLLAQITKQFPELKNSKDLLKFQLLSKYQFMNGMPHYEEMVEVASGDDLLERIKKNKKVVFTQTLENGSTLIGIKLGKRTRKFTKRIGTNNAAMLPYPVLIEDGKAIMLDPKYYISFMYPLLQMTEFMTIATIPDAMIKDAKRVFKKKKKK